MDGSPAARSDGSPTTSSTSSKGSSAPKAAEFTIRDRREPRHRGRLNEHSDHRQTTNGPQNGGHGRSTTVTGGQPVSPKPAGPLFCCHGTFMGHRESRSVPKATALP